MIKNLRLKNFKCFGNSPIFNFSTINLLTGINGRGKSTLLQSILILAQSLNRGGDLNKLIINDEFVDLGNYDDIRNSDIKKEENIQFDFEITDLVTNKVSVTFGEDENNARLARCNGIVYSGHQMGGNQVDGKIHNDFLIPFFSAIRKTHFISADRLGPVKYVDKTNLPEFIHVGPRGENTINILANSDKLAPVNDSLYLGNDSKSIIQQATEWLSYILEGARIQVRGRENESSVLYMLLNNRPNSYNYKPANVGFGYSYVLPIIVTGLIAKPGEIIILENPEAHLHPRAQSRIGEFLVRVASSGIQVFIESHSEHILNSIRVCSLKPDFALKPNDISIIYFNESFSPESLLLTEKGKIPNWPAGFFDQQDIDLSDIFRFSR